MGDLISTWVWGLKYVHGYGGSNKYLGLGLKYVHGYWGSNEYLGLGAQICTWVGGVLLSTWVWGLKYVHQYGGSNKYLGILGSNVYTDWDSNKYLGLWAKICT